MKKVKEQETSQSKELCLLTEYDRDLEEVIEKVCADVRLTNAELVDLTNRVYRLSVQMNYLSNSTFGTIVGRLSAALHYPASLSIVRSCCEHVKLLSLYTNQFLLEQAEHEDDNLIVLPVM